MSTKPALTVDSPPSSRPFDVDLVRKDFPFLEKLGKNGLPVAYLDSAASAQKPRAVLDAAYQFAAYGYANIHRGLYSLSQSATTAYEAARAAAADFIHASSPDTIVFTRNATEGINLVAATWGRANVQAGDEILISHAEHHANIVPWQMLCGETGATLKVAPVDDHGRIDVAAFSALLSPRTKLVAVGHMSNVTGILQPVEDIIAIVRKTSKALVLVDGCQMVVHDVVDVRALDCDFYVFSGHKLYSSSGIGVLYGRPEVLATMPPYQGGGDMIDSVSFDRPTTFQSAPQRFEAGTPAITEAVALHTAIQYLNSFDRAAVHAYEQGLLAYAEEALGDIEGLTIIGNSHPKGAIISFVIDGIHPHDLATILDFEGVAIRTGQHCAQPLMERLGIVASSRASFGMYSTKGEVDRLVAGIHKAKSMLL